ncbi:mitochondrial nucleoid-associated protein 1 isoform X2 [Trachinotus anak]|uniref:mitochondrial nucleoid-associated protein 1 isoform X2 n=1 Tax=Trachinotus anak TaxID=443729 RepID=UPI0039F1B52C
MSSEVCPFCGKTYKRLKSHLPHCKAAANSKTPPTEHRVKTDPTTWSSQLDAGSSEPTAKGRKSTQTPSMAASPQSKKSTKPSAPPQSSSPAASLPPSTKKKKQKLSEQIKMAATPSSTTTPLISSPAVSQSPSPSVSKPQKKSLRALIEASKSGQVTKGSLEGTRSASGDLPSGSLTDPLKTRATAQTETGLIPDDAGFSPSSTDTKPKDVPKKKASKTKKAAQTLSTTKDTDSLDSGINEVSTSPHARDDPWVHSEGEREDLSVNKMFLKSGSGLQARITIQDVKATLGRVKTTTRSSRAGILSQVETTDKLSSKTRLDTRLSPVSVPAENRDDAVSCLVTTKTLSDELPSATSQHPKLQLQKKSSNSKPASSIPLERDGSSQPKPAFPAPPLLSGRLSAQVGRATLLPRTASMNEGLKVGHHMAGLPSISASPIQFSCPHLTQTLPARVELPRADEGRKQNAARGRAEGAVTQRRLGQVRLRELPEWLACKSPSRPRDVVEMVQRGWLRYYRRYIDVRKGGVGGLGMLLAGYCVLSYIWSYPHIKRDRWRKYH